MAPKPEWGVNVPFLFSGKPTLNSMERWITPIVAVVVVLLVLVMIPTQHHWIAIILLLGIIFYGLFSNPMHQMHQHTFGETREEAPKRKMKKKRRKK